MLTVRYMGFSTLWLMVRSGDRGLVQDMARIRVRVRVRGMGYGLGVRVRGYGLWVRASVSYG